MEHVRVDIEKKLWMNRLVISNDVHGLYQYACAAVLTRLSGWIVSNRQNNGLLVHHSFVTEMYYQND